MLGIGKISGVRVISLLDCVDVFQVKYKELVIFIPCLLLWIDKTINKEEPTCFYLKDHNTIIAHPVMVSGLIDITTIDLTIENTIPKPVVTLK